MKFSMLPQPIGLLEFMPILCCVIRTQRRELCLHDFLRYIFNIGLHWGTCEQICFKLGMMLGVTKLYSMSLIDLYLQLRSQGYGKARAWAVILL